MTSRIIRNYECDDLHQTYQASYTLIILHPIFSMHVAIYHHMILCMCRNIMVVIAIEFQLSMALYIVVVVFLLCYVDGDWFVYS